MITWFRRMKNVVSEPEALELSPFGQHEKSCYCMCVKHCGHYQCWCWSKIWQKGSRGQDNDKIALGGWDHPSQALKWTQWLTCRDNSKLK